MILAQFDLHALPQTLEQLLRYGVLAAGYFFLLATSGWVVERVLSTVESDELPSPAPNGGAAVEATDAGTSTTAGTDPSKAERDIGRIIGKCENVLVVTFVVANAFTALALVFGAKSIVRREDMQNNSRYYLAGTLVNFTYSLLVGGVLRLVV